MKKKVTIKFLDDNPKVFEIDVRDTEYLNIVNKNKSSITKNKKQEELPDWFNKDLKNEEMTEDDMTELDNILN